MIDTFSIRWHVKSSKNSRKKSSAALANSLKHGAVVPDLSFNEFLNASAEVVVSGNFFPPFTHCPLQFHKRLNIGFYRDMTVKHLFERCARCTCKVLNFTLNFFFLTSDNSGSCRHLIFKWKWLFWMKAVLLQPSGHRWHLSLFLRESAMFFEKLKPSWKKLTATLPLPSVFLKFGIATWKTHEKFSQNPIFKG